MIGRPKVPLVLTTPEQQALDSLAHRARTAPQVARRARIVLACPRGLDNQTVAKKLRVSPQMVGRWRARFVTLEAAIWEFLDTSNAAGKPFVWTKSADEILASIARFAQRTLVVHN